MDGFGLKAIQKAYRKKSRSRGTARAAVCYYYYVRPILGKQEIRKAVRRMTKKERIELLACAGAKIAREIEYLRLQKRTFV